MRVLPNHLFQVILQGLSIINHPAFGGNLHMLNIELLQLVFDDMRYSSLHGCNLRGATQTAHDSSRQTKWRKRHQGNYFAVVHDDLWPGHSCKLLRFRDDLYSCMSLSTNVRSYSYTLTHYILVELGTCRLLYLHFRAYMYDTYILIHLHMYIRIIYL